jgi:hypothetical protein
LRQRAFYVSRVDPAAAEAHNDRSMTEATSAIIDAVFIDAPRDPDLRALHGYWNCLRGSRAMPRRAELDPGKIPRLLPYIIMYNVAPEGGYTVRLVGEEVVRFVGRNATGQRAGSTMPPRAAEMIIAILDSVTAEREPRFRSGKAHWHPDKAHRDYEACFLPLSADGETVNIILCGIKFPGRT